MAVRLPTPKVDLSGSILDPSEILGGGGIRTTRPDVTTDSDLPRPGLYRAHRQYKVSLPYGFLTPWRRTTFLAAFLRCSHSCAPTIATAHRRTVQD